MFLKNIDKRITVAFVTVCIVIGIAFVAGLMKSRVVPPPEQPTAIVVENKDGFPLAMVAAKGTGSYVRAEFCYALFTNEDWQLGRFGQGVTLTVGDTSYPLSRGGLSLTEFPANVQGAKRCAYAEFEVPESQELGEVSITVDRMMTSLPEVYDCEKAQRKLDQSNQGRGIIVKCRTGEHSSGFDIVSKPEEMTLEQAAEIAIDAGFASTIYGPWIFTTVID